MVGSLNGNHEHKERLYEIFSRIGNALANPHRLEILDLLIQAPRTVDELASLTHMSIANTSQHLQRLKQARLVDDRRSGQAVRYHLADLSVMRLWLSLRSTAEHQLGEIDQALNQYRPLKDQFKKISMDEFRRQIAADEILVIDVRPEEEYRTGHLPGTISMPIDSILENIDSIPKEKMVVAYCRGPYCVYADQALEILSARGWQVARLEEGVAEWQAAGNPLEV